MFIGTNISNNIAVDPKVYYPVLVSYRPYGRYLVLAWGGDPLTMLVSRIPRGANKVCTTRD